MKKCVAFLSLLSVLLLMNACQKEVSFENSSNPSSGSLQADGTGECLPKNVSGVYEVGVALDPDSNYMDVQVDVGKTGSYIVTTDTINGMSFRSVGVFNATGLNTVTLKGSGTPLTDGINNFTVTYDTTQCSVAVTTLPAGGAVPAVFTLSGAPNECMNYTLAGTYIAGTPLNISNNVTINVNVTSTGTYNISTPTSNGMIFSGTGALAAVGAQTITLTGSGTPDAVGTASIPVTVGSLTCSFGVPVTTAGTFTIDCGTAIVNGNYVKGVALTTSNTVDIQVTVDTPGPYSISNTVNGMTFVASGTFPAPGPQTITLAGSGTPVDEGTSTVSLTSGTSPCSFEVFVLFGVPTPASGHWQFTEGATTYEGEFLETITDQTAVPTTTFYCYGESETGDVFEMIFGDLAGGIGMNETYSASPVPTGNIGIFSYVGPVPKSYYADFSIADNTFSIIVTGHDTATKTITGTFAGKVEDEAGNLKEITNGTFSVTYQ